MTADNFQALPGNIAKFRVFSTKTGESADLSGGVSDLRYYESVLSNSVTMSAVISESGFVATEDGNPVESVGVLDNLPIRGGEQVNITIADAQNTPNELKFQADNALYVNRVRNADPQTQSDVYILDFCSRELFANEQSRVVKRYGNDTGVISENVEKILKEPLFKEKGILTKKDVKVDKTAINYQFIGNDRKPFYVCTWLASKSVPEKSGEVGGAAGYFFYENYDGYNFRSIDALFEQKYKKKYIYTESADKPEEYDGKILSYTINKDIDLQNNLTLGTYANRSIFFDFFAMDYKVREYNIDDNQKDKIVTGGRDDILSVADEFRKPVSRLMSHVLDVGTLPPGRNIGEQLANWKNTPFNPTYDAANTMVQSIMRYNQMFLIKINIIIPGDFSLRAGDLIHCEFPKLEGSSNKDINKETGGIYMIASLCHRITPRDTFTSMTLVRDSFGRKPF
jgi:hypothetical protein